MTDARPLARLPWLSLWKGLSDAPLPLARSGPGADRPGRCPHPADARVHAHVRAGRPRGVGAGRGDRRHAQRPYLCCQLCGQYGHYARHAGRRRAPNNLGWSRPRRHGARREGSPLLCPQRARQQRERARYGDRRPPAHRFPRPRRPRRSGRGWGDAPCLRRGGGRYLWGVDGHGLHARRAHGRRARRQPCRRRAAGRGDRCPHAARVYPQHERWHG